MTNAMLDMTPSSMEDSLSNLGEQEQLHQQPQEQPQEQPENAGQAVVLPLGLNGDFNPPASSTPDRDQKRKRAEKRCRQLHKEKHKLQKRVIKLKKQLEEMKKEKDKFRKNEVRLKSRQRVGESEKCKQRSSKKLSALRKQAVVNFLCTDENSCLLPGKKTITKTKPNRKCKEEF